VACLFFYVHPQGTIQLLFARWMLSDLPNEAMLVQDLNAFISHVRLATLHEEFVLTTLTFYPCTQLLIGGILTRDVAVAHFLLEHPELIQPFFKCGKVGAPHKSYRVQAFHAFIGQGGHFALIAERILIALLVR